MPRPESAPESAAAAIKASSEPIAAMSDDGRSKEPTTHAPIAMRPPRHAPPTKPPITNQVAVAP